MREEVEKYLKATRSKSLGEDRQYSFRHVVTEVCCVLYYTDKQFYEDFWSRITDRKGFSVGNEQEFRETMESFIDENRTEQLRGLINRL